MASEDEEDEYDKFLGKLHARDVGGFSEPGYLTCKLGTNKYMLMGYSETQILIALEEACDRARDDKIRQLWEAARTKKHEQVIKNMYEALTENAHVYDQMLVCGRV